MSGTAGLVHGLVTKVLTAQHVTGHYDTCITSPVTRF